MSPTVSTYLSRHGLSLRSELWHPHDGTSTHVYPIATALGLPTQLSTVRSTATPTLPIRVGQVWLHPTTTMAIEILSVSSCPARMVAYLLWTSRTPIKVQSTLTLARHDFSFGASSTHSLPFQELQEYTHLVVRDADTATTDGNLASTVVALSPRCPTLPDPRSTPITQIPDTTAVTHLLPIVTTISESTLDDLLGGRLRCESTITIYLLEGDRAVRSMTWSLQNVNNYPASLLALAWATHLLRSFSQPVQILCRRSSASKAIRSAHHHSKANFSLSRYLWVTRVQKPLLQEVPRPTKSNPEDRLALSNYDCSNVADISTADENVSSILLDYAPFSILNMETPDGVIISIDDWVNQHAAQRYATSRTNPAFRTPHYGLLSRLPMSRYAHPILPRIWWDKHAHAGNLAHWAGNTSPDLLCPTCGASAVESQAHIIRHCRNEELGKIRQAALDRVLRVAANITEVAEGATASKRIRAHRKKAKADAASRGHSPPTFTDLPKVQANPWGSHALQASALVSHFHSLARDHPDGHRLWTGMLDTALCAELCSQTGMEVLTQQRPAQTFRLIIRLVRTLLDAAITIYGHRARLLAKPAAPTAPADQPTSYRYAGKRIPYPSISGFMEPRVVPTRRILRQDTAAIDSPVPAAPQASRVPSPAPTLVSPPSSVLTPGSQSTPMPVQVAPTPAPAPAEARDPSPMPALPPAPHQVPLTAPLSMPVVVTAPTPAQAWVPTPVTAQLPASAPSPTSIPTPPAMTPTAHESSFERGLISYLSSVNCTLARPTPGGDSLFRSLHASMSTNDQRSALSIRLSVCDTLTTSVHLLGQYDLMLALSRLPQLRLWQRELTTPSALRAKYIDLMRMEGTPGGSPEIKAFVKVYGIQVTVYTRTSTFTHHAPPTSTSATVHVHLGEDKGVYWGSTALSETSTDISPSITTQLPFTDLFSDYLRPRGLAPVRVPGRGDCLFESVASSLPAQHLNHNRLRSEVCDALSRNPALTPTVLLNQTMDDPALSAELRKVPGHLALKTYVQHMRRPGTYGGHLEVQQISDLYHLKLIILTRHGESLILPSLTTPSASIILGLDGQHYWGSLPSLQWLDHEPTRTSPGCSSGAIGIG